MAEKTRPEQIGTPLSVPNLQVPRAEVLSNSGVCLELQDAQRIYRFFEAFENLFGRKPSPADAEGDFRMRVAEQMEMSTGGARYYLRLAAKLEAENAGLSGACQDRS